MSGLAADYKQNRMKREPADEGLFTGSLARRRALELVSRNTCDTLKAEKVAGNPNREREKGATRDGRCTS